MLNSFVCGSSNLAEEEHEIEELLAPCSKSTLKKQKKIKDSNNPYANRGLDKFSALLDELESKKQKIYTQKGSHDISFVRFVYSTSNDWMPIVVKTKERNQEQNQLKKKNKHLIEGLAPAQEIKRNEKKSERSRLNFKREKNLKDMIFMIVLILLFLVVFGKTFAIFSSSFGWYFLKMIKDNSRHNSSSTRISSGSSVDKLQNKKSVESVSRISSSGLDKPKSKKSCLSSSSNSTTVLSSGLDKVQSTKSFQSSSSNSSTNSSMDLDKPENKKNYCIVTKESSTSPRSVLGGLEEELSGRHVHRKSW